MEPIEVQGRSRGNGLCETLLVALALYSLVPGDASAGESQQSPDARRNADAQKPARAQIAAPSFPAPFAFSAPGAEGQVFSPTEFRPRKPGLLEAAAAGSEASVTDAPMLRDTSIVRELSEAKTQDRVRLLTLWQSRASSLYLQAGKRGAPTLQWSTPWMQRETDSRGLFDRLLPAAPRSFGSTFRAGGSRQAGTIAVAKPFDLDTPINNK
jgi:hypothetical protein